MHFLFGDHFINSRNLFSWLCIGIVRKKFMLVTIGPGGGGTPLQEAKGDVPLDGVAV